MTNREIIQKLESSDEKVLLETLQKISKEGNNEILVKVIDLIEKSSSTKVRDEIIKIIENLKEQDSSKILIDAITNPKNSKELSILVSACWKNGLNYEEYLDVFIDIFVKSEFQLAFDAFTVIDTYENVDESIANINLIKLENSLEDLTDDKKALCTELINVIQYLKENPAD
ncbi:MAG: hypothetical protein JEY96_06215 [Bacteroidales bacterium]|nr:hypothetical protein [Bacteroidales bacterium]